MNRKLLTAILILFFGINSSFAQFRMGNTLAPIVGNSYPIIMSNDAQGGLHQVATIAARNAIPALRRQQGMLCAVLDAGSGAPKTYQLVGGILDANWVEFTSGTTSIETDPIVKAINGIVKSNGSTISAAVAGTDYLTPAGSAALLTNFPTLNQNTTGNATTATTATNWSGSGALGSYLPLAGGNLSGALTGTTANFSGVVISGAGVGFQNASFATNVSNPIWAFGNAPGYGIAYYQGTALPVGDAIGFHFGNIAAPVFTVNNSGALSVTGSITAGGNVTAFSDIRLKKNIRTLSPVSASLRKINAVEFDRKDITLHQLGFIAQNVQQYFPDLITVAKDSMATLSLNYQAMTAPLLKGWQEHDTIIIKQQGEIEGLTKEIALLKESIEELKKAIADKK